MSKELKVLTYNIHKGFSTGNRRFVLHAIREAIQASEADLLFLQEMQGEHSGHARRIPDWPAESQFKFLAGQCCPHYAYGRNAIYEKGHHGNAILSKYPFSEWENIKVTSFSFASRSILHGIISINEQDVHVVCIHFGLFTSERRRQLEFLCERINTHVPDEVPLLVAGDFNDWRGHADQYLNERLGLTEVFKFMHGHYARSWPSWLPVLTMDRIYYRGLQPLRCERLTHDPWRKLSDHAPLFSSFVLSNGESR